MDFNQVGKMAIGTRMRLLSERLLEDAAQIYELYEIPLKPKWFPVFYILSSKGPHAITDLATEIGQTHPSVIKTVREMTKQGITQEEKDKGDGRKTIIALSSKGKEIAHQIQEQYTDVNYAVEQALLKTRHNLWEALEEFEFLLSERSFVERVKDRKKERVAADICIVSYKPSHQSMFYALNEAWITRYFKMEEADYRALRNPQGYIIDRGGYIFIALYKEEVVGTCALIKLGDSSKWDFELAKMAVAPKAQGKGIGRKLGQAIIEKAKSVGAKSLFLESNTVLTPAINLYHKLGFQRIEYHDGEVEPSEYERCNIQMELIL